MKKFLTVTLLIIICISLIACNKVDGSGAWENATYLNDEEFGDGSTTIYVVVAAQDQSVTFTINTDKATVGDALIEHKLIAGEESAYGLYNQ